MPEAIDRTEVWDIPMVNWDFLSDVHQTQICVCSLCCLNQQENTTVSQRSTVCPGELLGLDQGAPTLVLEGYWVEIRVLQLWS